MPAPPVFNDSDWKTITTLASKAIAKRKGVSLAEGQKRFYAERDAYKTAANNYADAVMELWRTEIEGYVPGSGTLDSKRQTAINAWVDADFRPKPQPKPPVFPDRPRVVETGAPVTTTEEQLDARFDANIANTSSGALPAYSGPGIEGIVVSPEGIVFGQWFEGGNHEGILVNPTGIQFGRWDKVQAWAQ